MKVEVPRGFAFGKIAYACITAKTLANEKGSRVLIVGATEWQLTETCKNLEIACEVEGGLVYVLPS